MRFGSGEGRALEEVLAEVLPLNSMRAVRRYCRQQRRTRRCPTPSPSQR